MGVEIGFDAEILLLQMKMMVEAGGVNQLVDLAKIITYHYNRGGKDN